VRVQSLAPLVFKVLQSATAPIAGAWTAAATTFTVSLDEDLEGTWQNVQSSGTGLDLGVWDENKDPLEIVWPGLAAAHADLVVGDVFQFQLPGVWAAPSLTALPAARRFTSAHWRTRFRAAGAVTAYLERGVNSGTIAFAKAVEADRGNLSRYAFDILRTGAFEPTVELERSFADRLFADAADRHGRLDVQMLFEGRQLSAAAREGFSMTYPSMAIAETERPISDEGKIVETVSLIGETNDAGDPPCTLVVTTDRDWTPTV
jgi:hypothetical protein